MQKKSNQIIGWFNWMDVLWLQKRNRTQKVPLPVHTKPFPSTRGDNRRSGRRRRRRRRMRRRRMLKRKLEFFSSDASGADVWGWETGHKWWGHKCSKGDAVLEWPHCHCPSFFPHNHNDQNRDHYDHNVLILMITHNISTTRVFCSKKFLCMSKSCTSTSHTYNHILVEIAFFSSNVNVIQQHLFILRKAVLCLRML